MNKSSTAAREKWSRIIEEQRASGLTVAGFCEERRIPASSFFPWRKKLKGTPADPAFVEARVRGETGDGRGGVTIELVNGRRVMVSRGFDRALLLEVIGVLESDGEAGA